MKKILIILLGLGLFATSYSQRFNPTIFRVGGGAYHVTDIKNTAITVKGIYEISYIWEAALSYAYIPETDYTQWHLMDVEAYYIFYGYNGKLNVYGLAGLGFKFWSYAKQEYVYGGVTFPEEISSGTEVGFNIGVGANYNLTKRINIAPEIKFTLMENSFIRLGGTVQYMF